MKIYKKRRTYITTPIYYPNAILHVGHAYTTIMADILARFRRLEGNEVYFITGSDEHGQKLLDKATELNENVYDYVSKIVESFKELWNKLDISYDNFIRTTDKYHIENVQQIFSDFKAKDFLYKDFYSGFYCKSDESYFTKNQLNDNKCPVCNQEVSKFEEEAYFLKVSESKEYIKELLTKTNLLIPKTRVNELVNSFLENLTDLSITRKNLKWGIEIPTFDNNFVVYVWFDALLSYLSAFKTNDAVFELDKWNDEETEIVQFIGKEIIRFHAIYWPIILKKLNLKQPQLLAHGWLVVDGKKMSKSLGNGIDPIKIIELYGSDALRFYFINSISFGSDGKFSTEGLIQNLNGILVNKYSNLVNRTFVMNEKYFNGVVPHSKIISNKTKETDLTLKEIETKIFDEMSVFNFNRYVSLIIEYIDQINNFLDSTSPWFENDQEKLKEIIWYVINRIYSISLLFNPIIPNSTKKVLNIFNPNGNDSFNELFIDFNQKKIPTNLILFERFKDE